MRSLQHLRKSQALSMAKLERKPLQQASHGDGSHSSRYEQGKIKNTVSGKQITLFRRKRSEHIAARKPFGFGRAHSSIGQKRKRNSTALAKQEDIEGMKALWRGKIAIKESCTEKSIVQKIIGRKEHCTETALYGNSIVRKRASYTEKHCTEKSIVQKQHCTEKSIVHRKAQKRASYRKHWQKRASCRTKPRLLMALQEHVAARKLIAT